MNIISDSPKILQKLSSSSLFSKVTTGTIHSMDKDNDDKELNIDDVKIFMEKIKRAEFN